MIAIIDYGVGNLYSLSSSLSYLGIENIVTNKIQDLQKADKIILPGVGAFKDAIKKLENSNLIDTLKQEIKNGKHILGICLGMQILFETSYEYGKHKGLGLIEGDIIPLENNLTNKNLKVPHIGWNKLDITKDDAIFKYSNKNDYVYYVHSYYAKTDNKNILATSEYSIDVTGVVKNKNVYGMQFHPEKSGNAGLNLLKAFNEL